MNGVVFHTSTRTTEVISMLGSAVHAIGSSITPSDISTWLMKPYWSLSSQPQIFADTTVGIAHGIRIAARTMPRPGNARLSTSATPRPSTVSIPTENTVNHSVFLTARHHTGSASTPYQWPSRRVRKLASPTDLASPICSVLASVKPSQIVRISGQPATSASSTSIGARNSQAERVRLAANHDVSRMATYGLTTWDP